MPQRSLALNKRLGAELIMSALRRAVLAILASCLLLPCCAPAQTGGPPSSVARITKPIDDTQRVTLRGNTRPETTTGKDLGAGTAVGNFTSGITAPVAIAIDPK